MKKLRFKSRNGILYFGIDGKFKSSKLKYSKVNKNILIGKYRTGGLDENLSFNNNEVPKLIDLVKEVIEDKTRMLKQSTLRVYHSVYENHITPYFQGKYVISIKPIDIKKFQDKMVSKGVGAQLINVSRILMKEAFNNAILSELVTINPIKMVEMPKFQKVSNKVKQNPFTLDEIDAILETSSGELKNFLGISFFTGMRSGEVLALKWSDIDFDTDTISISKTISKGFITTAKTLSSERDIEMLPQAKVYFKKQQLNSALQNSYVFLNTRGTYHNTNTYFYHSYRKVLSELNLELRSLHNTRHTFASIMLNNKVDAMWVSNTLGHENLNITLGTYAHFMPRKEKMSLPFLEKRYKVV